MNKKFTAALAIVLVILMTPQVNIYKDGGTKTYTSFAYKLILWHKLDIKNGYRTGAELHFFPNNFHTLDYYEKD